MSFMNVGQLITLLKCHDPELRVYVEGCDCTAEGGGVAVENRDYPEAHKGLMILRSSEAGGVCHELDNFRIFTGDEDGEEDSQEG